MATEHDQGRANYRFTDAACPGDFAQKARRSVSREFNRLNVNLVPWLEVFEPRGSATHDFSASHQHVYIRREGAPDLDFAVRKTHVRQYYQRFFDSDLGKQFIAGYTIGRHRPTIYCDALEAAKIPIPSVDTKKQIAKAYSLIDELRNELNECEKSLWEKPATATSIISQLKSLVKGDATRRWAESLPLPLASILVPYTLDGTATNSQKCERLLCFFEAIAAWLATVGLSVARSDSEIWNSTTDRLKKQSSFVSISKELTFGGWRTILAAVSSSIKSGGDSKNVDRSQSVRSQRHAGEGASSTSLAGMNEQEWSAVFPNELMHVLAEANDFRNQWKGHDGLEIDERIAKSRLDQLHRLLVETHSILGHGLSRFVLAR